MLLQVTNPGTQDVLTTIPCGLIFEPDNAENQRLMVIQALSATVGAGQDAELGPYIPFVRVGKDIANGWLSNCGVPVIP